MAGSEVLRGGTFEVEHGGVRQWSRASSLDRADVSLQREGRRQEEDEALREAALEKLVSLRFAPKPHRKALLSKRHGDVGIVYEEVDVKQLSTDERVRLVELVLATEEVDNAPLLTRLRERLKAVGLEQSSVEVRFEGLSIQTDVYVGQAGLPSVPGAMLDYVLAPFTAMGLRFGRKHTMPILQSCSGILKPGRLTLLLGPPSSGKSTLLKALGSKLDLGSLRVTGGTITYNGHGLDEFVVPRTSAYIEQRDNHIAELTVRETLDFAARCQGAGNKPAELRRLLDLEAQRGISPDPSTDAFMKAEAVVGARHSPVTELYLRLLGLEHVADTVVGGDMLRGISGGQKKRVTTGEMAVGPCKTLFMDETSTGLDSTTTFQIVKCVANYCHLLDATVMMSLLQPAPEVYNLFDDVCLLSEGRIVFFGSREEVMPFFNSLGFALPERKGIADFLQEVTSRKDQHKYWATGDATRGNTAPGDAQRAPLPQEAAALAGDAAPRDPFSREAAADNATTHATAASKGAQNAGSQVGASGVYNGDGGGALGDDSGSGRGASERPFFTVPQFAAAFLLTAPARRMQQELSMPFDRASCPPASLVTETYGLSWLRGLRAMLHREVVLTRRNSFVFVFQSSQIMLNALVTSALFFRTTLSPTSVQQGGLYMGVLFFSLNSMLFNNWAEFSMLVEQLPIFFKQRDNLFFRASQFHLPRMILNIPQAILEALVWSSITYWMIGLSPEPGRFFTYWLVNILMHQNSVALYRLLGAISRTMAYANATSVVVVLIMLLLGGYVIPHSDIGGWWIWAYWINPLTWAMRSLAINEFNGVRWQVPDPNVPAMTIGDRVLAEQDFYTTEVWIWAGVAALVLSAAVLNLGVICALGVLSPPKEEGGTVSAPQLAQKRSAMHGDRIDGSFSFWKRPYTGKRDPDSAAVAAQTPHHTVIDVEGKDTWQQKAQQQHDEAFSDGSSTGSLRSDQGGYAPPSSREGSSKRGGHFGGSVLKAVLTGGCHGSGRNGRHCADGSGRGGAAFSGGSGGGGGAMFDSKRSMVTGSSVMGDSPRSPTSTAMGSSIRGGSPRSGDESTSRNSRARWARALSAPTRRSGVAQRQSSLPFEQLWLTFKHVWYSVDLPAGMVLPKPQLRSPHAGSSSGKPQLYLLNDVSGAFRPNVLTALVGASGAGKTTLMDVLAGRKTAGRVYGDVRLQGHCKDQRTFARVAGYVEQDDFHSPQATVREALLFSASLRLGTQQGRSAVVAFAEEIMRVVELDDLANSLVGFPGRSGLSVEQRKRLTIAVELVANPSIVFMDEPTSGLDARAAAIVMRAVRNTVDTGRTVVCTIHQPSIDIFETFHELVLMKRGGRIIYCGPLGHHSRHMVSYFQAVEGVPHIHPDGNPASWVLDVTMPAVERRTGQDFADIYERSHLYTAMLEMVEKLEQPPPGSKPIAFDTQYARGVFTQFRVCLWKYNWLQWRSPDYNAVRLFSTLILSLATGSAFYGAGRRFDTRQGIVALAGSAYTSAVTLGIFNACAVQPAVAIERTVFIRERAAGTYTVTPYLLAQIVAELPYIFVQTIMFTAISYPMLWLRKSAACVLWYALFQFLTLLYMTVYGIASIALTSSEQVAAILSGTVYFLMELFCGFIIGEPFIPKWVIWLYWLNPVSWTVYGTVASQLSDVTDQTVELADGGVVTVAQFVRDTFGFRHDWLGIVTAGLLAFSVGMWLAAVWGLRYLKYHKR